MSGGAAADVVLAKGAGGSAEPPALPEGREDFTRRGGRRTSVRRFLIVPLVALALAASGCKGSDNEAGRSAPTTRLDPARLRELDLR
jgi:hypothetical protein